MMQQICWKIKELKNIYLKEKKNKEKQVVCEELRKEKELLKMQS